MRLLCILFYTLFVLLLASCAPGATGLGCEYETIEVTPAYTIDGEGVDNASCAVSGADGHIDYSACCPEGWDFLAPTVASGDGSRAIVCERTCEAGASGEGTI